MLLKDKVALVTGGAGGIGKTIVRSLASEGCRVVAVSRSMEELIKLKNELKAEHLKVTVKKMDVTRYNSVKKTVDFVLKKYRSIDILVNAAGIYGPIGELKNNDIEKWASTIEINLLGTVNCVHAVLPSMQANKSGKIINLSGGGAVNAFPNFSSYATSKAAVVRFTETVAEELRSYNVQVNAIAPGAINTKLLDESLNAGVENVGVKFYEKIVQQKKDGGDSPQMAADLTVFLAGPSSFNITGKLISAKWDNWKAWTPSDIEILDASSALTLRRIDNKYFQEVKK